MLPMGDETGRKVQLAGMRTSVQAGAGREKSWNLGISEKSMDDEVVIQGHLFNEANFV